MGDEKEISGSRHRHYGSQPISVPFLWEQKPGMPKRGWNPKPVSLVAAGMSAAKPASSAVTASLPIKLVISVPFKWEEKPGKPLLLDVKPFMINEEKGNVFDPFAFDMHSSSFPSTEADTNQSGLAMRNELGVKGCTNDCSYVVRRLPTLGELFLLSGKLGSRRKTAIVNKYRLFSKEFSWKCLFTCFTFGKGGLQSNVVTECNQGYSLI